jgi:putative NIF3 family GTP cyclohydrolase 1 type 2
MEANEVLAHFREVGRWVDWNHTSDHILYGNQHSEVKGMAVAWIATDRALRTASEKGYNLFITHEPAFYPGYEDGTTETLIRDKKRLLDRLGITLMRCHDTWDRMPEYGIVDAWASYLGFQTEERAADSFYNICLLDACSVMDAARQVLERVRSLGQDTVLVFGNGGKTVRRMAVGTGAITHLPSMNELKPDVILATDDGMNFWTGGLWATDLDMPLLIVNHATSEKPGIQAMVPYLRKVFPEVETSYIDIPYPYLSVR